MRFVIQGCLVSFMLMLTACFPGISDLANSTREELNISVSNPSLTEGSVQSISVELDEAAKKDLTLSWEIQGIGAINDFTVTAGTLDIPKGSKVVNISLTTINDNVFEGNENYSLKLSSDTDKYTIASTSVNTNFILTDDDAAPEIQFTSSSASVNEDIGTHTITVQLDRANDFATIVNYTVTGDVASSDHGLNTTNFTIPSNQTSVNFNIPVTDDFDPESAEDLILQMTTASGNSQSIPVHATNNTYTLTINANDAAPTSPTSVDISNPGSSSGTTNDTTVDIVVNGGDPPAKICISETQTTRPSSSNEVCNGGAGPDNGWHTSVPSSIDISSGDGGKTIYIWIADSDGIVSENIITDTIVLDTVDPSVAVSSPASGSSVDNSNYNNFPIAGTCSENGVNVSYTATGGDSGSVSCSSGNYNISVDFSSAPNGPVSVTITQTDASGNSDSTTINYNRNVSVSNPIIAITDQSSSSSTHTDSILVNINITNDTNATKWCVSESQSAQPADTSTCAGSSWTSTEPTTFSFASSTNETKNLYVWIAIAGDVIGGTSGTDSIILDTIDPIVTNTTAATDVSISNYAAYTVSGSCDSTANNVQISASTAGGGPINLSVSCSSSSFSTSMDLSSLYGTGSTVDFTIDQTDLAGNTATQINFSRNLNVYSPSPTSLNIADSSASTNYARSINIDSLTIVDDASATQWCLSESQSTRPATTASCAGGSWTSTLPTSFTLSSGDGVKTVYLWTANSDGVVSQNSVSDTITLDTSVPTIAIGSPSSGDDVVYANYKSFTVSGTCSENGQTVSVSNGDDTQTPNCSSGSYSTNLNFSNLLASSSVNITVDMNDSSGNPAIQQTVSVDILVDIGTPSLSLSDASPAESGYALDTNINVSIGGDSNATLWCLSDTQSSKPASTNAGSCGGSNWLSSEPTSLTLSAGDGTKTYYVWIADGDGIISNSAVSDSIILDTAIPSSISGLSLGSAPNNTTSTPTISWSGNSSDSNGILKYQVRVVRVSDSNVELSYTDITSGGSVSSLSLNENTQYRIEVFAIDNAGNMSAVTSSTWTVPILDPILSLSPSTSSNMNITSGSSPGNYITFTISNTGNDASANLHAAVFTGDASNFEVGNDNCTGNSIAAGANCSFDIRPKATADGSYSASVSISDGAVTSNSASLSGNASGFYFMPDPTLSITSTGNTGYINSSTASINIGNDSTAAKWCVSFTQSTQPADTSTCAGSSWTASEPTSVNFAAGNGSKIVYVWVADASDIINDNAVSASTYLDVNNPNPISSIDISSDYSSLSSTPIISWTQASDADSGLWKLQYQLEQTSPSSSVIVSWTDFSVTTSLQLNSLSLSTGDYKISIKALDNSANESSVVSSSTWYAYQAENVKAFKSWSAGVNHGCGISSGGDTYCLGQGLWGTLGMGAADTSNKYTPTMIDNTNLGTSKFLRLSIYENATCGVTDLGEIYCFGSNLSMRLGDNTTTQRETAQSVDTSNRVANTKFIKVTMGRYHACALGSDGTVYCWGDGTSGKLGKGSQTSYGIPTTINSTPIGTDAWIDISAGFDHTCGLTKAGKVYCWGDNAKGQTATNISTAYRTNPTIINTGDVTANEKFYFIKAGSRKTCGITNLGKVYCWGFDANDSLGIGGTGDADSPKLLITTNFSAGEYAIDINAGGSSNCLVTNLGYAYCMGYNMSGELGVGNTSAATIPTKVVMTNLATGELFKSISGRGSYVCALTNMGNNFCWGGSNTYGQQGSGTGMRNKPTAMTMTNMPTYNGFKSVYAGATSSCGLATNGKIFCWGDSASGALANGVSASNIVKKPTAASYANLPTGGRFLQMSFGVALASDNKIYTWGADTNGVMGNGVSVVDHLIPTEVDSSAITSGILKVSGTDTHKCALTTDGKIYCWGDNTEGQIGDGTNSTAHSPTEVNASLNTAEGFRDVHTAPGISCALTNQARAFCWGNGANGGLGNGGTADNNTPVLVSSSGLNAGEFYVKVRVGLALTSKGRLLSWGDNTYGEAGRGTTGGGFNTPAVISTGDVASDEQFSDFNVSDNHRCGLTTKSKLYCWGFNSNGQLGDNSTANKNVPTLVAAGPDIGLGEKYRSIGSLSSNFSCVTTTWDRTMCFGAGTSGQLGDGTAVDSLVPISVNIIPIQ